MVTMFRNFELGDLAKVAALQEANGLPPGCAPDLMLEDPDGKPEPNPLFIVKRVCEFEGQIAMLCFVKLRTELYLYVDHNVGTPEQRWEWLQAFTEDIKQQAWKLGLDQLTAFVPPDVDESFAKRMVELGFERTKWIPYSMNLE
jgi:hypothetical protein